MKHSDRMSQFVDGLHPRKGTRAFTEFQKFLEKAKDNPKIEAVLKKSWTVARATVTAQIENGAGRDGDEALRYFMVDACNRFWTLGVWDSLSASFNVMADFMEHDRVKNFFRLREEVDHEFCLTSFLDFATSPGTTANADDVADLLSEGKVYHFTNISPLEETTVGDRKTQRFVLASCSMVRHEDELSVCMVLGQPVEAAKGIIDGLTRSNIRIRSEREKLTERLAGVAYAPEALRGNARWWKLLLLTRFDLRGSAFQVRYVLQDCGPAFYIISDDPAIWFDSSGSPITEGWEERLRENTESLKEYGAAFELAYYSLFLPKYFNDHVPLLRPRVVR